MTEVGIEIKCFVILATPPGYSRRPGTILGRDMWVCPWLCPSVRPSAKNGSIYLKCSTEAPIFPNYIFDLERSKVKVKDVKIAKM